jgi:hypothetical protein
MRKKKELRRLELGIIPVTKEELKKRYPSGRYTLRELVVRSWLAEVEQEEAWRLWDLYGIDRTPLTRAERVFDLLAIAVPKRIRGEEVGDALEDIGRRLRARQPNWKIYAQVFFTLFWVLLNSLREIKSAGLGKGKA